MKSLFSSILRAVEIPGLVELSRKSFITSGPDLALLKCQLIYFRT